MAVATILSPGVNVGGKYEVVEVIGFGGMGVVYKVREQVGAVSRIRALKTVLPQFASDAAVMRRFREEAEKMCMLEHENIVPVLSYSEEGQFPYLVMPFIEGQSLKDYLAGYTAERGRGLPLSEVMEIGLEVVRGLEIAHRFVNPETRRPQPMVHRDIKPGNIMVRVGDESGERRLKVLIMDFGIAKILSDKDSGHSLTEVIGTVKYASPEQIRRGKDIDPRADIYSLGMVLYELYAGRHMFTGMTEHAVLMHVVQRDLKDFEIPFPDDTPESFREFIARCVAVDRDRRFRNVGEMRAVMRRILEEDSESIVAELAHARELAQSERARAVERGAEQFAPRTLAEGDELLAQGDASIADHKQRQALSSLRSAAEAFARAAEESTTSRERNRLARGLSALAELRAAALAAGAERLAPQAVVAAAEATRVLEKALEVDDLTGGGHALGQAELAWRHADDAARREQLRLDAVAGCDRLEAAIAATRAELAPLPAELREAAGPADLELADTRARAARASTSAGDFERASQAMAAGMALLAEVDRRRVQLLSQHVNDLSERLRSRLASIDSSPDVDHTEPAYAQTHAAADAAQGLAAEGRHLAALAAFESTLTAVGELERQIARRAAEREQALHAAERDRLVRGLSALAELRGAALAAGAERLAPQAVVAAAEATRVLEKALEVDDLTGGDHALGQAELAWRHADDAARREQLRLDAVAGCDRLEAAVAATRAELAPLPAELREAAGPADLELADTRARAARASTSAGDFEGASQAMAAGMALLAEVDRRRVQLLSQHVNDLSERLRSRLASIDSSPDVDHTDPAYAQTHAAADAAQGLAAEGRHLAALAAFESTLTAVGELERQIARRAAEREQALHAAERNRNAEPAARAALESLGSARAALAAAGTPAGAEAPELAAAVDEADLGESEFGRGEYAAALPPLRSAGKRLSDLAQAISQRIERERILARLTSLRAEATQKTRALGALGAGALDAPQSRRLLDALASAEQHAGQGDPSEAIRILEESLPELDRRVAEARTELELKHAHDQASGARERAQAALAAAERLGERATRDQRFAPGRDDVDRGLELYDTERFAEAASRFAAGEHALAELCAEIEEHERVKRLAALGRRRAAVVEGLGHLPTTRRTRRPLKAIRRALAAADDALAVANESEAGRRLHEIESSVAALLEQAAAQKATESVGRFAWRTVAIGGGAAAACLVGTLVWIGRPKTPSEPKLAEALRTPPISEPTMPREPEPTVAVEARATAAPPLEPTLAPISAPPTNAPVVEATMPPVVEATMPPAAQPTVAERPPPLVLASARPATRTVKVRTGSEPRFDASLKNGDDQSLLWQLGGETVGRGRSIVLGKEITGTPGRKRLDVVAVREGLSTPLRSWNVEIEAPPLGFAELEPANRSVERPPGVPVSFRAPVNLSQGEKLAFLWQVNGEPAHGADGPTYDFQPQLPGEYVVQVRATAPWGATIANTWNLSVRPVIPTPDLKKEVDKPDPRAGAQAWIQAYCTAFEKKDVEALLTLGHLTSETEAARLRDALASMSDLKVSCTNPSIRATGDDVVVSFDRTDRWTDPRGTTMERALPRITKHLHLANGRWVAAP